MKKQQKKLLLITFAVVIVTAVSLLNAPKYSDSNDRRGKKVFPEMLGAADSVQKVQIDYVDGTKVFEKSEGAWVFPEKENYPVNSSHIREIIFALTKLEYFSVGEVATPELTGRFPRLTLFDKSGKKIVKMHVGGYRKIGSHLDGIFINPEGEKAFWLTKGDVHLFPNALSYWVDQPLLNIAANKIKSIKIGNSKGVRSVIAMNKNKALFLANAKEGYIGDPEGINRLASSLSNLMFEDVMGVKSEHGIDKATSPYAIFETTDSLVVEIYAHKIADDVWVSFEFKRGELVTSGKVLDTILDMSSKAKGRIFKIPLHRFSAIMSAVKLVKVK